MICKFVELEAPGKLRKLYQFFELWILEIDCEDDNIATIQHN